MDVSVEELLSLEEEEEVVDVSVEELLSLEEEEEVVDDVSVLEVEPVEKHVH